MMPSLAAPAVAFGAGLASSFGPCIAPRFVAVASLTTGESGLKRWTRIGSFVLGLCAGYVLLGTLAGATGYVSAYSGYVYALLGAGLIASGLVSIVRTPRANACAVHAFGGSKAPHGAIFVAGLGFVAVGSPCCGPIAAALAGAGVAGGGSVTRSAALLAAFALGHATPLVAAAFGSMRIANGFRARVPGGALSTVGGALMMALGGYYALLA
ncbi:MAG: cytochrome c biogenesis protein CcdA [Candidatus Tumulicola sp.]